MAREKISRVAARKMKDKWKAKEWYKITAPGMFNHAVISETLADDPAKLVGRTTFVTAQDLTGDFSKMHIKLRFKITGTNGYEARTKFVGHVLTTDYIRRLTRRKRSKTDGVFDVPTKDGYIIRIKPMAVTEHRVQHSQQCLMRKSMEETVMEMGKDSTMAEVVKLIVSGEMAKQISRNCKKIYPPKKVEIRRSEIRSEPTDLVMDEPMTEEEKAEEDAEASTDAAESPAPEAGAPEATEADADVEQEDLTQITGVGPAKADLLANGGYRTIAQVKKATIEQIQEVEGIGPAFAKKVYETLHPE